MKRLHLDFVAQAASVRIFRRGLLIFGFLALGAVLAYAWQDLLPRKQVLGLELARQQTQLTSKSANPVMKPEELAAAWRRVRVISDQLNLPWSRLFTSMGSASSKDNLAFLSIEPDAIKGQIVIMAEARDFDAMLKFFQAMQASNDFGDVTLQSHLVNQAVAEKPVRFRLSARWKLQG